MVQVSTQLQPINETERALAKDLNVMMFFCDKIMSSPEFGLPKLPDSAAQILELIQQPFASRKDIGNAIENDAVLKERFLRSANMVTSGAGRISSIDQALQMIGVNQVRNLAVSLSIQSVLHSDPRLQGAASTIWNHAVSCATAASKLAPKIRAQEGHAFVAGLLHDIGKIPAVLFLLKAMKDPVGVRIEFIQALIEQHHTKAGVALLKHWNLPLEARIAITFHHQIDTLDDALQAVLNCLPVDTTSPVEAYIRTLAAVIFADRALAFTGLSNEPGVGRFYEMPLAADLKLTLEQMEAFVGGLPKLCANVPEY